MRDISYANEHYMIEDIVIPSQYKSKGEVALPYQGTSLASKQISAYIYKFSITDIYKVISAKLNPY